MVPEGGLDPPSPQGAVDFESTASTNSATPAPFIINNLYRFQFTNGRYYTQYRTHMRGPNFSPAPVSLPYSRQCIYIPIYHISHQLCDGYSGTDPLLFSQRVWSTWKRFHWDGRKISLSHLMGMIKISLGTPLIWRTVIWGCISLKYPSLPPDIFDYNRLSSVVRLSRTPIPEKSL